MLEKNFSINSDWKRRQINSIISCLIIEFVLAGMSYYFHGDHLVSFGGMIFSFFYTVSYFIKSIFATQNTSQKDRKQAEERVLLFRKFFYIQYSAFCFFLLRLHILSILPYFAVLIVCTLFLFQKGKKSMDKGDKIIIAIAVGLPVLMLLEYAVMLSI